jgi:hypothetical protein
MSDESVTKKAMRAAERGTTSDASRLVAMVPALMREAERRRSEAIEPSRSLGQFASWAMPRLAVVTAVAVIAAGWTISKERASVASTPTPVTMESVILGGNPDGTGDVVFDALLDVRRSDG